MIKWLFGFHTCVNFTEWKIVWSKFKRVDAPYGVSHAQIEQIQTIETRKCCYCGKIYWRTFTGTRNIGSKPFKDELPRSH